MKRKLAKIFAPLAAFVMVLGLAAAPAQAGVYFNVPIGSETCTLYGYYLTQPEARVRPTSCDRGQARIRYITSGGSFVYSYGSVVSRGGTSVASASTSMVVERAGAGAIVAGSVAYWSLFVSYRA